MTEVVFAHEFNFSEDVDDSTVLSSYLDMTNALRTKILGTVTTMTKVMKLKVSQGVQTMVMVVTHVDKSFKVRVSRSS